MEFNNCLKVAYHQDMVNEFIETYGDSYANLKQIKPSDNYKEAMARNLAV